MPANSHVLFAGGGAAGHLFPGLAVAEHLQRRAPKTMITFAGSGKVRERHIVRNAGYHYTMIPAQPTPHSPIQALRFLTDNAMGYCAARWMLREQRVSMVVGLGGYTSSAVVRSAVARGIPVVLLEQNAIPGRTTRWLSRSAALVCAAFDEVRPHLHVQAPVTVTGNPSRPAFEKLYAQMNRRSGASKARFSEENNGRRKRLVILGGAGGARSLNENMPKALSKLKDQIADWQIVHQTGEGQLQATEARYESAGVSALAVTFIDEIASVLFESDLVVCRAGGTTLAELALANVPALLVPYPQAVDNHQIANAKVFTAAGASRMIDESSQGGALNSALSRELSPLLSDLELRGRMAGKMQELARPQAASEIAGSICDHLSGSLAPRVAA
ncbi:UDP-N-acetylglucosamine--N-acetylmuramyl-(pentapeptide) pyrophosphoryl-undecaprenol N-acetylglucosamine transferase [Adhaeretor mobilis]|uniref:UDP-N-acetylglucosamine--N-acetylmuramyl-(pentapeptide) pyrophosphoryl-undecaprenol N-acetylglucosamine transferase n=1 Tax=Adhaeretor mobilis TaxID=1930276 RepID=A0A517MUR1_9BACT|nr:UDP-N-acetylglucosamine--N-acetylmuramyl-(pentapeptide) pyrophosphoryl-undecaprenol N-acetylglucosamine transferase [Adhaeretor mobilis]QDS98616.1 UDP-N-acetylglucosamine--N-acetylmuramyl-(pentapeptide) pyrophosphoryl-undecaprenol N-acetylglucosamine transferase MurG [Adhaeretor mobilis]